MKVLIVDDNSARHAILKRRLRDHVTYSAFDIDSFRRLADSERFDVAFLDHDLEDPNGDGRDVAKRLADMPSDLRPRHVVIQSWNFSGAREMESILRDAGYSSIVVSPFDSDNIGYMLAAITQEVA